MVWPRCWWLGAVLGLSSAHKLLAVALMDDSSCSVSTSDRLKLVQAVFRHGARTPLTDSYWEGVRWETGYDCGMLPGALRISISDLQGGPQPPPSHDGKAAKTVLPGGCTKGELTLPGQVQAREYGKWLRQRYMDVYGFLPAQYEEGIVTGRSTNYRRTIATLQGVITGLYPSAQQPVPIQTAEDVDEVLFGRTDSCERLRSLMKTQARALKESSMMDKRVHDLEQRVQEAMALPQGHRVHFTDLHDALTTMRFHGKSIPEGVDDALLLDINREATRRMAALVAPQSTEPHGPEMLRLSMGPLFEEIVERMAACASGSGSGRMYLYSGHDTTIMPILATLGVELKDWPEYVSNVVFELWERKEHDGTARHYVKVLYNKEPLPLAQHPQGEPIELGEFEEVYLEPYLLSKEQFTEQCKIQIDHSTSPDPSASVGGGSAVQGL